MSLTHVPSGATLTTDPAPELGGGGTSFSPIDTMAGALGACVMGVLALVAGRLGVDLAGMRMEVGREIAKDPWRIAAVSVVVHLPAGVPAAARPRLEGATEHCPVRRAMHPDVKVAVEFRYDL